jgi:nucleotide-binding universal stress UspA family protein
MYKKILAPVDGSTLSECSLDHVRAVATGCSVPEVVLLRVIEPLSSYAVSALAQAGGNLIEQAENVNKAEAQAYISEMVKKLNKEGIAAKGETIYGKAADEILGYTEKNKVDLIIMSTHGKSGISRWAFGSVADRVVRHSRVPVLTVAPAGCRTSQ